MAEEERERLAGNNSINASIHEILERFSEPSRSRMRRKIRGDYATLKRLKTPQADANARHTYREFLVGDKLNSVCLNLEYNKKLGKQTPDWYDAESKVVVEVFTCERGGTSAPRNRLTDRIVEKLHRYREVIARNSLRFIVAVHGDFDTALEAEDCKSAIDDNRLFDRHPDLSGVIFFGETGCPLVKTAIGLRLGSQQYGYSWFPNPEAVRKINLQR